jgi:hypothetical protein
VKCDVFHMQLSSCSFSKHQRRLTARGISRRDRRALKPDAITGKMIRLLVTVSLFVLTISFKCQIPLQTDYVKLLLGMTNDDGSNNEFKLIPKSIAAHQIISRKSYISAAASMLVSIVAPVAAKAVGDRNEFVYIDKDNGFSVIKALGWSTMPQQPPSLTPQGPELEEAVFVASSFLEGIWMHFLTDDQKILHSFINYYYVLPFIYCLLDLINQYLASAADLSISPPSSNNLLFPSKALL